MHSVTPVPLAVMALPSTTHRSPTPPPHPPRPLPALPANGDLFNATVVSPRAAAPAGAEQHEGEGTEGAAQRGGGRAAPPLAGAAVPHTGPETEGALQKQRPQQLQLQRKPDEAAAPRAHMPCVQPGASTATEAPPAAPGAAAAGGWGPAADQALSPPPPHTHTRTHALIQTHTASLLPALPLRTPSMRFK